MIYFKFQEHFLMKQEIAQKQKIRTVAYFDQKIEELKEQKKKFLARRGERVSKIVNETGLADLDITDDEFKALLSETLERFQNSSKSKLQQNPQSDPQ